jgi:hypothetical protein
MCNFLQTSDIPTRTRFFFGSRVTGFSRDPSRKSIGFYILFLQGSNMQKQYHRRTTLRTWPWKCKKGTLSDWPQLSRVTSTALLCRWGRKSLKDITSFGTDFETHAIWQGYIEDPAAKDFVARKAHIIALSKEQGTWQSALFTSLEISWGFHTQAGLCSLARPRSVVSCLDMYRTNVLIYRTMVFLACPTKVRC